MLQAIIIKLVTSSCFSRELDKEFVSKVFITKEACSVSCNTSWFKTELVKQMALSIQSKLINALFTNMMLLEICVAGLNQGLFQDLSMYDSSFLHLIQEKFDSKFSAH